MQNENNNQNINMNSQPNNPGFIPQSPPASSSPNQNDENIDLFESAKLQLEAISSKNKEELAEELNIIQKIREEMNKPGAFTAEEGIAGLEKNMRALNMPGIYEKTKAGDLIDLREEAIIEKNNLNNLGRDWNSQPAEEQNEIADRVRWGANCQYLWQLIIIRRDIRNIKFKKDAQSDNEKQSQRDLINMVINEVELDLSRNPETKDKARDAKFIRKIAEDIALSQNFLTLMNEQTKSNVDVRKIREEIENNLKEQLTNENSGNI